MMGGLDDHAKLAGASRHLSNDKKLAWCKSVVALYQLTFADPTDAAEMIKGEPVYLILAMDSEKVLRLKPQNLVTGLPVKHLEAVS